MSSNTNEKTIYLVNVLGYFPNGGVYVNSGLIIGPDGETELFNRIPEEIRRTNQFTTVKIPVKVTWDVDSIKFEQ